MGKSEVERRKEICQKHGIGYNTFVKRIQRGLTEEEAINGYNTTCKLCGKTFKTFSKSIKYCCHKCKHEADKLRRIGANAAYREKMKAGIIDIEGAKDNLESIYNRPLTCDTKYLVNLWHNQGDSAEEIAYILRRPADVIRSLIIS